MELGKAEIEMLACKYAGLATKSLDQGALWRFNESELHAFASAQLAAAQAELSSVKAKNVKLRDLVKQVIDEDEGMYVMGKAWHDAARTP